MDRDRRLGSMTEFRIQIYMSDKSDRMIFQETKATKLDVYECILDVDRPNNINAHTVSRLALVPHRSKYYNRIVLCPWA
jgi:hypothetical protein